MAGEDSRMIDGDLLLKLYCSGCFPMWEPETEEIALYRPDPRAVIELDGFHVPRRLAARIRQVPFRMSVNEAFIETFDACHANRTDGSWMSGDLRTAYLELHARGFAHSVEAWNGADLVGGLYGVHIGAAFMAESKFSDPDRGGTDASKICLVETVKRMRAQNFELLDVQFVNPHLEQFGVVEITAIEYDRRLQGAISRPRVFADC